MINLSIYCGNRRSSWNGQKNVKREDAGPSEIVVNTTSCGAGSQEYIRRPATSLIEGQILEETRLTSKEFPSLLKFPLATPYLKHLTTHWNCLFILGSLKSRLVRCLPLREGMVILQRLIEPLSRSQKCINLRKNSVQ